MALLPVERQEVQEAAVAHRRAVLSLLISPLAGGGGVVGMCEMASTAKRLGCLGKQSES